MLVEIPLDDSIYQHAEMRVRAMPVYNKSHRKVGANQTGVIGEVVTERFLSSMGVFYSADKTTEYDLRLLNGQTIDVKTKERSAIPRERFDCSVPLYNHDHQRPDYYLFVSLKRDKSVDEGDIRRFTHAYILGAATQEQLAQLGRVIPANTLDDDNGMRNWTGMVNIPIEQLTPSSELVSEWLSVSPNHSAIFDYRSIPLECSRVSRKIEDVSNAVF